MNDSVSSDPPELIETFNDQGRAPVLILCDHGGNIVPYGVGDLGVSAELLGLHIGWDIGAADVARRLARRLRAPAIINHTSRLIIDPNRRPYIETSIPAVSDRSVVPGNRDLSREAVQRRIRDYFLPYHRCIARRLGKFRQQGVIPALIAVHSFTGRLNGEDRPWQIGILWRGDRRLSNPVLNWLREQTDLVIGDNQPYSGMQDFGFTVTFHAQRTRLPHLMIEIRHDQIDTAAGAEIYADLMANSLELPLGNAETYRLFEGNILEELEGISSWRHASRSSPLA